MTVQVKAIFKQAESLSVSDQLALATLLIERARRSTALTPSEYQGPANNWMNAAGVAPYPLTGEDAQAWVSRNRQEGEDEREQQLRPTT